MRTFGPAALALLLPVSASAFPCNSEMRRHEALSSAEVLKQFGKAVVPECNCYEEDCEGGAMLTYEIPLERTAKLTSSFKVARLLGRYPSQMTPLNPKAEVHAFLRRLSAHPLGAALLARGPDARCDLNASGSEFMAYCVNGPWKLSMAQKNVQAGKKVLRVLVKLDLRLPLEAFKNEPEFKLAQSVPLVSQFLAGRPSLVALYGPNSPRRLIIQGGAEAVTIFFKTAPDNGWADATDGVLSSCDGEQMLSCPAKL
jgi:hypothetical protein